MSFKTLLRIILFFLAIAASNGARANTYYVDYGNGSDSNSGTSTSSPWKHAPGMQGLTPSGASTGDGCASVCSSTTISAGDFIILKGGVTWPYTTMPWTFTRSGSSSTQSYGCAGKGCIYVGNAVDAGLPAWNAGVVNSITLTRDLGGWSPSSPPVISCSGGGGTGAAASLAVVPTTSTSGSDAQIAGYIYKVKMNANGSGYTSAPGCVLTGGNGTATLVADINRPVIDFGATQGSPPDWPWGICGSFGTTCVPVSFGNYNRIAGIEFRNMLTQNQTGGGTNDEKQGFVNIGSNSTATDLYVHGVQSDCVQNAVSCSGEWEHWFIDIGSSFDEASYNIVQNGDFAINGTSAQAAAGVCNGSGSNTQLCMFSAAGIGTGNTQSGSGPVSIHNNWVWMSTWTERLIGNDASGTLPYLTYNNEYWLTAYQLNNGAHINARYTQVVSPAAVYSYNNIVHSQVGGTSSQRQCPSGVSFYFFNEVQWGIGTGTQPYSLDMNDVSGTGGCTLNAYNNTMQDSSGDNLCVDSQAGTNLTVIVVQNLHCVGTAGTTPNPFWSTGIGNSTYRNQAGTTAQATAQASSIAQSLPTANGQGYVASNLYAPTSSSNDTVTFGNNANSANLTSLCSGNLAALCNDINGNSRPTTGGWQAGAYQFGTGAGAPPPPAAPTGLTITVN